MRLALVANLFNLWHDLGMYDVTKSTRYPNGQECYEGQMFIACAILPSGPISFYVDLDNWDKLCVREVEHAPVDVEEEHDVIHRLWENAKNATVVA